MASFRAATGTVDSGRSVSQEDSEVSVMLANALRKMDGLIGDYGYMHESCVHVPSVWHGMSASVRRLLACILHYCTYALHCRSKMKQVNT